MRSHKLRYLLVGVVLFAMSWLGYWIGYISADPRGNDVHKIQGQQGPIKDHKQMLERDSDNLAAIKAWNGQRPMDPRKVLADLDLPNKQGGADGEISTKKKYVNPPLESLDNLHPVVLPEPPDERNDGNHVLQEAKPPLKPDGTFYMLLHSGRASKVPGNIHERLQSMPSSVEQETYIFTSNR